MELMTKEEGEQRLQSVPIETYREGRLHFSTPVAAYSLPKEAGRKNALAHALINYIFADKPLVMVLEETDIFFDSLATISCSLDTVRPSQAIRAVAASL